MSVKVTSNTRRTFFIGDPGSYEAVQIFASANVVNHLYIKRGYDLLLFSFEEAEALSSALADYIATERAR